MPDTRWPDALRRHEAEVSGDPLDRPTAARHALLRQARDKLERVTWHDRWDMSAMAYADDAAELLRRAGRRDLADECSDEFGVDAAAVIAEIERECGP